jgi:hypothetical protein
MADAVMVEPAVTAAVAANAINNLRTMTLLHPCAGHSARARRAGFAVRIAMPAGKRPAGKRPAGKRPAGKRPADKRRVNIQ